MENINGYVDELLSNYSQSKNRIFFLDYDGTLAAIKPLPEQAEPTATMKELLLALGKDSSNQVLIISGRERESLENWLGDLPLTLVAEHGGFWKKPNQPWQSVFDKPSGWKDKIYPSLQALVLKYKGSFIEEKHYSLAWHYRTVSANITEQDQKEILATVRSVPTNNEFLVYDEDCTLEIRTAGIDKGKFASQYMKETQHCDFILAMGDGETDEDLFEAVGKDYFTIKVGESSNSLARFFLDKQDDVPALLRDIIGSVENDIHPQNKITLKN